MSLATSTSAKALQRPSADKACYLFDGSLVIGYWNGTAGQVAQVTSPLTSPSVTNLFTTTEDGLSIWADNSSGTSSDIWVASSDDDASGAGPAMHLRHGTYNGSSFSWDTATSVPGTTQADTIQCSVTWNGTYLMVFWWDGVSGSDRISYNWTTDKTGQTGWLSAARAACFSEANNWSTVMTVAARHSANLSATIVNYAGNSRMHYGCMPDSASSGPVTGATLTATSAWSGTTSSAVTAGAIMAVKPSGTTPVYSLGTVSQAAGTSGSLTGSWNSDQTRTSGDLLVAVASATGTTSATTPSTATSGWSSQLTAGNATKAAVAVWTKTAAGSDAAPAFTSTISGTAAMTVTLFVLKNAATSSFIDASGTTTGTAGAGFSVTTSGNIATNGCFAVAAFVRERAAVTTTYTPAVGWANVVNDGATSSTGHCSVDAMCGPTISRWGGRTTFDTLFTDSFGFGGCATVIDEANGNIHVARAVPNVGGPTMGPGVCYWKGTYNGSSTNTVTYTGSLTVDSTSTTTGPPDVAIAVDINGKVYVLWVTDQTSDSMKYSTLVSPYTSAVAGGTFGTGGSTPRYPHCPPLSKSMAGLDTALPVLYMDATSTPFPVNLDTSVTLPGGSTSISLSDSGSGADSVALGVAAPLAEAGTGADAVAISVPVALAEAGTGADGAAVLSEGQFLGEAGTGADVLAVPSEALALADTGGGTDALAVPAEALGLAEAGTGTDSPAVALVAPLADTGAGTDALAVPAEALALSEAGAGSDSVALAVAAPLADSGAGTDVRAVPSETLALADSGTGADSPAVPSETLALADAAAGTDAVAAALAVLLVEAGTGTEALAVPSEGQFLGDAGAGADVLAVPSEALALADAGAGADNTALAVTAPLADAGAGADVLAVPSEVLALADSGTGTDSLAVPSESQVLTDSGTSADSLAVPSEALGLAEAGTGADALSVNQAGGPQLADSGTGTDTLAVPAETLGLADSGTGADALSVGGSSNPQLADSGTGTDSAALAVAASLADAGAGADVLVPAESLGLADAGTGSDTLVVAVASVLADSGTGLDQLTLAVNAVFADAGLSAEQLLAGSLVQQADAGSAADALQVATVAVALTDSGTGQDQLTLLAALALADAGRALDAVAGGTGTSFSGSAYARNAAPRAYAASRAPVARSGNDSSPENRPGDDSPQVRAGNTAPSVRAGNQ